MRIESGGIPEIVEALQQPVWTVRPDGIVDYANSYWRSFTGLMGEDALGQGWATAVHPDDVAPINAKWHSAVETGNAYEIEYRFRRADGEYRWHLARVTPVRDAAGSIIAWVASAIDIDDRWRAEEALRDSEARYRELVDNANDIIYTLSLDGRVLAVNPAVERVLGYRPDQVLGQSIERLVAPDQLDMTRSMLDRKLHGESESAYELDVYARSGRRVALELNTRLTAGGEGPPVIHGIARDVSMLHDRVKQAELSAAVGAALTARQPLAEQLQRCAQALVTHLDAAFARIWTIDEQDASTLLLRASAGMYTHLDGAHSRIPIGTKTIGRIAAMRRPHLSNAVVDDPGIDDKEWVTREGLVAFAGYPVLVGTRLLGVVALFARHPLEESTLSFMHSVVDEIAVGIDRDRAERAQDSMLERERVARMWAQTAEARYRGVFEGVADAIILADAERHFLDANAAGIALFGYEREELLRFQWEDVITATLDWTRTEADRLTTEGTWEGEIELRRKDGAIVPVEVRSTFVDLPDGQVILSALRDITDRRHFERLQRDFLAMVTHDLRSPLTAIKGRTQLLKRRTPDDERVQGAVASILSQIGQMERLIDDLAELVRIEARQLQLHRTSFDLVELAREQVLLVQEQTSRHKVRVQAPHAPVAGSWDRQRLGQVVQNLLLNAVKYSPEGCDITVRVDVVHGEAQLAISDRGVGISPDHIPRLFDRFYRADVSGAGGLGLGLHISKMFMEAHGGRIWVESRLGEGSTFTVALPMNFPDDGASSPIG
jgi:PAS domain S-box-containing protein